MQNKKKPLSKYAQVNILINTLLYCHNVLRQYSILGHRNECC